ncbi:hypothetical protein [Vibrio ulleungensis]|uniref:RND transporter n=1 Tax=Vibrio ulleungensis TaxID=2807619 RepID=A0ABS2HHZ7_9VIBR|nr:hypothetical protein [Vibrio ulleungensis]MBM7037153.1 hypothetical protein [Vibrio ulleungensis]
MAWIDNLSWPLLLLAGGYLVFAPFFPEPHIVEKLRMLTQGNLVKPIDIFDLLMHASPIVLIALKAYRQFT